VSEALSLLCTKEFFLTAASNPLQASVQMAKCSIGPSALPNCSMNQVQLSLVSDSKKPKSKWVHQVMAINCISCRHVTIPLTIKGSGIYTNVGSAAIFKSIYTSFEGKKNLVK
jgi:hypothetical protein